MDINKLSLVFCFILVLHFLVDGRYKIIVMMLAMCKIQEFYRLCSSLRAKREHASLLEDFREYDRTKLDLEEGSGSPEQALLHEHASISRSSGQVLQLVVSYLYLTAVFFGLFYLFAIFYETGKLCLFFMFVGSSVVIEVESVY